MFYLGLYIGLSVGFIAGWCLLAVLMFNSLTRERDE